MPCAYPRVFMVPQTALDCTSAIRWCPVNWRPTSALEVVVALRGKFVAKGAGVSFRCEDDRTRWRAGLCEG